MASYHCKIRIIGRSDGRSAVAAAAYRAGARLVSAETGVEHDYRRKSGVESAVMMLPPNAPDWAKDRGEFWDAVEAKESRKNSQLSREFTLAIPHELTAAQGELLVYGWVRDNIVELGIPADVCIHDPDPGEYGDRNRHCHIMTGMRGFDPSRPDGWAKTRNRAWNDVELLGRWRESWSDAQNAALEAAGSDARVDHRSLIDQMEAAIEAGDLDLAASLDRPPEPVMGIAVSAVEGRARASAERNGEHYEPVTEIGMAVAKSRDLRSSLISAMHRVRDAVTMLARLARADHLAALAAPADPFAVAAALTDPFAAPPASTDPIADIVSAPAAEDPPEDTEGGLSYGM